MYITSIRMELVSNGSDLKATCSITLDDQLVIHGVKVVNSPVRLLVSMPAKAAAGKCSCGRTCDVNYNYCPSCGKKVSFQYVVEQGWHRNKDTSQPSNLTGAKLYFDIAHPANPKFRAYMENEILAEYHKLVAEAAENPGV